MNSLIELKKITQSLNEKITDPDIDSFQTELLNLKETFKSSPYLSTCFNMLQSLGSYLGSKKDNAHIDATPLLNSIMLKVEKIVNTPDLQTDDIKKIVLSEIQRFRALKNSIASTPIIKDKDINELKEVILSIDWEISDKTLEHFDRVLTGLLSEFENNKLYHAFLRIIYNSGRYIGTQKANAHTDSITFLRSAFENFEHLIRTPQMPFKDKIQMIENEIKRFNDFKLKISQIKKKPLPVNEFTDDETVQPALSHIKQTNGTTSDDVVPLTELSEQDDLLTPSGDADSETIEPALSNIKKGPGTTDVMDDLFSVKESPADELLDAIHLMDVHGDSQDQAMTMLDQTRDSQSEGVKNITAERLDNDPIPEIGNRLDEFFNLEPKEHGTAIEEKKEASPAAEIEADQSTGTADGIVPFGYEDESFEEIEAETQTGPTKQLPSDDALLSRLTSSIKRPDFKHNESSLLAVNENISVLKERWQDDADKIKLLELLTLAINPVRQDDEKKFNENKKKTKEKEDTETAAKKPAGFFGRLKGFFSS